MKPFQKIRTTDRELMKVQDNVNISLTPVIRNPLLNGVTLDTPVVFDSDTQEIEHGLGRLPIGWIIISKSGPGDIWEVSSTTKLLSLSSSSSISAKLYVF